MHCACDAGVAYDDFMLIAWHLCTLKYETDLNILVLTTFHQRIKAKVVTEQSIHLDMFQSWDFCSDINVTAQANMPNLMCSPLSLDCGQCAEPAFAYRWCADFLTHTSKFWMGVNISSRVHLTAKVVM